MNKFVCFVGGAIIGAVASALYFKKKCKEEVDVVTKRAQQMVDDILATKLEDGKIEEPSNEELKMETKQPVDNKPMTSASSKSGLLDTVVGDISNGMDTQAINYNGLGRKEPGVQDSDEAEEIDDISEDEIELIDSFEYCDYQANENGDIYNDVEFFYTADGYMMDSDDYLVDAETIDKTIGTKNLNTFAADQFTDELHILNHRLHEKICVGKLYEKYEDYFARCTNQTHKWKYQPE